MKIIKKIITELKLTDKLSMLSLLQLTLYTIVFCAIIALIILGADVLFQWGLTQFLNI